MKKFAETKRLPHVLWILLILCVAPRAWAGIYQHGTVVRMRMGDCLPVRHGFLSVVGGGPPIQAAPEVCPEYTLVSDKVVFVIVGSSSDQVVPLADVVDFRFHKNELAMRIDDSRKESKFMIKEMVLRTEWDLVQKHIADRLNAPPEPDNRVALRTRE